MKILAFAASSSRQSINKQLANYAANQAAKLVDNAEVELLDINDYEIPLFSEDREKELGQPALAKAFFDKIGQADAIVISFAEHNGSYTAAYKNLFDWTSRIDQKVFQGKPTLLLATSPGPGGASSVLAAATGSAPYFAAEVKGSLSVPSFYQNFDAATGEITDSALAQQLTQVVSELVSNS
ncbi:NADPH-dependent FMN reductase [Shewanella sp. 10N.286.51.B7]|uniref:NADPH-dependent FMN reductase n=1 Tax=unclassified Shewanella TaxID=196818 RepID=UPI000C82665F|nr:MULTISPECIES: NAD(P)H-dependent oxidoreductase [unclassified Shewanella]MCC4833623.1 NAD(P)H-dependent oxidoreductase [Shewanella sp. 10N.7]PMG72119.1 NADPH-dependent FMN reductase [Shewanella sp. 10N.286.51.B7]